MDLVAAILTFIFGQMPETPGSRCLVLLVSLYFVCHLVWWSEWTIEWRIDRKLPLIEIAVAGYCFIASQLLFAPLTYIYLTPSMEIADFPARRFADFKEARLFVVRQHQGAQVLNNVKVTLRDNNSGESHEESLGEIDPVPNDAKRVPRHFWWTPSKPWDEDYTVNITSRERVLSERIVLKGIRLSHVPSGKIETTVHFAVRVTSGKQLLLSCEDQFINESEWLLDPHQKCQSLFPADPLLASNLPERFNIITPDGFMDTGATAETGLTSQPPPEATPDTRRLTDWQQKTLRLFLERYPNRKVLILASGGSSTWRYARDFRDVFRAAHWKVKGPVEAPKKRDKSIVVDVQLSVPGADWNRLVPEHAQVLEALKTAQVKCMTHVIIDPNIKVDVIVLWVGVKSPDQEDADNPPPVSSPELTRLVVF